MLLSVLSEPTVASPSSSRSHHAVYDDARPVPPAVARTSVSSAARASGSSASRSSRRGHAPSATASRSATATTSPT
ncbi:hypothetical protein [Georgenia sp. SUBG003]|uniref:hypothetical protein n=1 Tax=Georgenia sp. SUBG003 TaxID=1497974 RepID=UPI003AB8170D